MKDLGIRSISAVFWGAGGSVARLLIQFAAQIALARILGPEQYGLFAIGAIVISFSNFFSDIGMAYGLIQKKEVCDSDIRFVMTWQIVIGSAVALCVFLLGKDVAIFFGDVRATDVVKALAIICLLNALAAPSLNLLKRELNFRSIQIAQLLSYVVGYLFLGIPLALSGCQVWALVAAWAAQAFVSLLLLYRATRHPISLLFWYPRGSELFSYGITVLATNITNWAINNIDRVIVGRVFGSREIGLYATAYNFVSTPATSMIGILQPVFFSASARKTEEPEIIISAYRTLVGAIAFFVLPIFAGLAAISDTVVLALYGSAWQDSAELLRPIALAMPLYLLWGMSTPLLWTSGKFTREFISQIPVAAAWGIGAWLAAQISIYAVAWSVVGLFIVRSAVIVSLATRAMKIPLGEIWVAARGGFIISAGCVIALVLADMLIRQVTSSAAIWLLIDGITGFVVWGLLLKVFPKLIADELCTRVSMVLGRLPKRYANCLRVIFASGR